MGRYWSVLLFTVACSSGEQATDGSGGATDYTVDTVSPGGWSPAVSLSGSSGKTAPEKLPSTGGVTSAGGTSPSGGSSIVITTVSYGGTTYASTYSVGGATFLGGASPTGGNTSTSTSECLFVHDRPNEGACSVYSKGRFYCLLGVCTPSDISTGYRLDCDHDGAPETNSHTDDNCGACGNSCRELFLQCMTMGYNEPWYECQ